MFERAVMSQIPALTEWTGSDTVHFRRDILKEKGASVDY
jgi:hypothetical protein